MKPTLLLFPPILSACLLLAGCGMSYTGGIGKTYVVDALPQGNISDSVTVIPGPEYKAGWLHSVLFGKHYRDLWTTPIRVPVLNMTTFAGGLIPLKQGGGYQTKSLRLQGADGRLYAFRSADKDPKKILPLELQETFAADVVQDQISSSNPAAALVVDVLADALGVLHPKPRMVLLPDDERLAEYRETFAGILGIIEDYPGDGPDGTPGFAGSKKIVSTISLYERLEKDNDNVVNPEAMLTARLLDMFVGDWDRHIDQWRWARFEEDGKDVWYPIPRDRDQAFAQFDGFLPNISAKAITQFEHFEETFNDITSLTFSGRFVDRRLLVSLDKEEFLRIAADVRKKLTDEVIEEAVLRLPPEFYAQRGEWLVRALKNRRQGLMKAAERYYELLSDYVDVHFSDKGELVNVTRLDGGRVEVAAFKQKSGKEIYRRTFDCTETSEIRLYLHGGDDRCIVKGDVSGSILVRVIGGGGDDELVDESHVQGPLWGFIPFIKQSKRMTLLYDDRGKNSFAGGRSTVIDESPYEPPPPGLTQY